MARNPAPGINPRDPVLGPHKGFWEWVHRRLDAEVPPLATGTATWNPGSIADGAATSTTLTVTGASLGDVVMVSHTSVLDAGALLSGSVIARDTVRVVLVNHTGGAFNLASGTLRACVWRYSA